MNDFETVRANPLNYHALRALDRIEAEVEGYRETLKNIEAAGWNGLQAEVERLRAALEEIATASGPEFFVRAGVAQDIARAALAKEVTPIQTDP
jgi:aspartate aminotransferase-like enzyme